MKTIWTESRNKIQNNKQDVNKSNKIRPKMYNPEARCKTNAVYLFIVCCSVLFHNECLSCFCSILVFSVFKSCPIGTPKRHAMRHTYNNYPETQLNLFCVLLLTWQYLISFRFILWLCLKIARVNKLFDQIKRIIS